MPFDQTTRNRLARLVGDTRDLLDQEFTRQLQHEYGIDPKSGDVTPVDKLKHLDDRNWETARLLRDTIEHYVASSPSGGRKEAIRRIIREQAFTVLNRLCAIRMAEARGLIVESVGRGYQSKGFQLYSRLAGTALGETGDAYRCYLFSLFDELSVDLAVLFDRFSPQGRLFPREAVLLQILEQLNSPELELLWIDDETIGWIYQYFNSIEERKQMRAESQAPRNSRELAIRNQFFTPRYVVEFLTDNTLGRIWYEMRKGETALRDSCRYLVRRPNNIFLAPGEKAPKSVESDKELSQEELLKQTVHFEHRPKKDPRDLNVLDPAVGSGHFLLYAFDLMEAIYEEAWEDTESPKSEATGHTLHTDFATFEELRKAVPELILRWNLHGIDIDPRCAQIAGLALWLRAQRSWHQMGLRSAERPPIRKSNIVIAEPMPGEKEMLKEFTSDLKPRVLGQLVEGVFDKMKLAGEAGSLLKIEVEITGSIANAKKQWKTAPKAEQGVLFADMKKAKVIQGQLFDVSGISDEQFWEQAEDRIMGALKDFAEKAENGKSMRRQLFAEDAARGFAFIDLCRKRYDVVLMNPPYGSCSESSKEYLAGAYPASWIEAYIAFCERAIELCNGGLIGAITSRTFMYLQKFLLFRKHVIHDRLLIVLLDLGGGILDDAAVETAAWVFEPGLRKDSFATFVDLEGSRFKETDLLEHVSDIGAGLISSPVFVRELDTFDDDANCSISYSSETPSQLSVRAGGLYYNVKPGLGTRDDFRFARLRWEVPRSSLQNRNWVCAIFGSQVSRFYADHNMVINWSNNGLEMKSFIAANYGSASRSIINEDVYFKPGLTYQYTGSTFRVQVLPKGCVVTMAGQGLYPVDKTDVMALLGILNSSQVTVALKEINPGRFFQASYVSSLRLRPSWKSKKVEFDSLSQKAYELQLHLSQIKETSPLFCRPIPKDEHQSLVQYAREHEKEIVDVQLEIDKAASNCLDVNCDIVHSEGTTEDPSIEEYDVCYWVGLLYGRWDIRITLDPTLAPIPTDHFDPLPVCPPGMLIGPEGMPAEPDDIVSEEWLRSRITVNTLPLTGSIKNPTITNSDYPLRISWNGILVDDLDLDSGQQHRDDIVRRIREVLDLIWHEKSHEIEQKASNCLETPSLHDYVRKPSGFFQDHLKRYSKNRRKAPIYWPLSTASGSYTIWLYYQRLSDQTLFNIVNEYIDPKLKQVAEDLNRLRTKKSRSSQEEKQLEPLSDLELELRDLRAELLRIATFWKPNLNDGVQITAAPLWGLFRHNQWRAILKETWESLEAGEYDWAHLAYSIWPDRVREKCKTDKSLAIAHDLEGIYEGPKIAPKKSRGRKSKTVQSEVALDED